ncbi:BQ5605_C002g01266 [Microbotryum silenes-dioicae]|uniref:BQ5605_C002g01266 protein n=1 Tax=Microbotryum silenes-dioicae TaxID=796604 RepID=A0A2X0LY72_9BASI|nr:BQ5605_C002g01266 [Microbotryum silenes-dioicae]
MTSTPQHPPRLGEQLSEYEQTSHRFGEGYSSGNKIPSIGTFLKRQEFRRDRWRGPPKVLQRSSLSDVEYELQKAEPYSTRNSDLSLQKATKTTEEPDASASPSQDKWTGNDDEKSSKLGQGATGVKSQKEIDMEKAASAGKQPNARKFQREGEREVMDPVTGQKVVIRDAKLEDFRNPKLFDKDRLDPSKPGGPSTNIPDAKEGNAPIHDIAPSPVEPGNILMHHFPPPVTDSVKPIAATLDHYALAIVAGLGVTWFFVAFGSGYYQFVLRSAIIGALAVGVYVSHGIVGRKIEKEFERIRLDMHKQRGEKFSPPTPESVEWLNAFTKVVWTLINPSMFVSLVDMIEDVMQASLPGFIDAVKVEDFTIGKNALRIISMRALPDQPNESGYPHEEWIDQGSEEEALDPSRRKKKVDKRKDLTEEESKKLDEINKQVEGEDVEDEDQTGDYVNFEVSFGYFAPPGTKKLQGENISLIIKFFLGAYDLFHLPIPIWIAVESIVGTVRMRCQMVANPPFIRNVTFTLMGVPAIEASAIPLARGLPNVLDLPLISGFVQSSIAAATSIYCAPKSMTMNVAQIISGDGIKKETKALGVFMIKIHYAEDLSAQDDNGFSDPYVVLAYAKFGKPLFSTRIIERTLNPVWEQTAFLLVTDDEIRADEKLSVQLWDSDKLSADDLVGRITVPLIDLMLKPNEVHKRSDKLMGYEDSDSLSGTLHWEIAYYEKAKLNPDLKAAPGIDHNLPKELQDHPELKVDTSAMDNAEEADVRRTPPDSSYPTGILSVIIHQINNLERQNLKGASGKDREGHAGQDTDDPSEAENNLPSAYCEIVLNDDMVYKTRVKQYSQMPFFEAGGEWYIPDYTNTTLRVVVRDSRLREHDPILGIVNLPLDKILAHSSQVTRLYAIQDGVGFGKISISVLFKGVKVELPGELRGWNTGTVCVTSNIKVEPIEGVDFDFKAKKIVLSTLEAKQKVPGRAATVNADGSIEWDVDEDIRLPTYDRYSSALFFDYGGGFTFGPLGDKTDAYAACWLSELVDDEEKEIRVPIVIAPELERLRQNRICDQLKKTHDYTIVGWLTTTVMLDAGLDEDHEQYAETQTQRHEFEVYDRVEGMAAQAEENSHADDDGGIDKQEKKQINRAHKKALESRHRGKMQFAPVRTGIWAKDSLSSRIDRVKRRMTGKSLKQTSVQSEAG